MSLNINTYSDIIRTRRVQKKIIENSTFRRFNYNSEKKKGLKRSVKNSLI